MQVWSTAQPTRDKPLMARFLLSGLPLLLLGLSAAPSLAQAQPPHSGHEHHHHAAPAAAPGPNTAPPDHGNHTSHGKHAGHDLGPADDTYDLRFLDAMIEHHYGALLMSELVIGRGFPGAGELANTIIRDQSQEIGWMLSWRRQWYPSAPESPLHYTPGKSTALAQLKPMSEVDKRAMRMIDDLDTSKPDRGREFARAMIHHHEMAIAMAEDALTKSRNPSVRWLAWQIILNQREELRILHQLLA